MGLHLIEGYLLLPHQLLWDLHILTALVLLVISAIKHNFVAGEQPICNLKQSTGVMQSMR